MTKLRILVVTMAMLIAAVAVTGQTRLDKPMTHKNSDFLFMGNNGMNGTPLSGLRACIAFGSPRTPMAKEFKSWITDISNTAALKMYNLGRCDLVGFQVEDKPGRTYRNVDSFKDYAAGKTMYRVETDRLIMVKKFAGEVYYIVAAKGSAPHKLTQLDVCGPAQIIQRLFKSRKRTARVSSSYCHNLQQQIDKVKTPTRYSPSLNRVSAVIFTKKDYLAQKKRGLFRNQAVYEFDGGDTLSPIK